MSSTFTKLLIQARKDAGLTQEQAARKIGIALRTMANYEAGRIPSDPLVAKMVQVYDCWPLAYAYLSLESSTGRLVAPKIEQIPGIAAGAMQLHISMKQAAMMFDPLENICCDDIISHEEEAAFLQCTSEMEKLVQRYIAMKLAASKQKKSLTAATVKLQKQEVF